MLSEIYMLDRIPEKVKNIIGMEFGMGCIVIGFVEKRKTQFIWLVECGLCHKEWQCAQSLIANKTCSNCCPKCSRTKRERDKMLSFVGYEFGLGCKVLELYDVKNEQSYWKIRCGCGEHFITNRDYITRKIESIYACKKCTKKIKGEKIRQAKQINRVGFVFGKNCIILKRDNKPRRWIYKCGSCQREFSILDTAFCNKRRIQQECKECAIKSMTGPNSSRWNYDLTIEQRIYNHSLKPSELNKFRKDVFKRDDYICKYCNKKGGKLNAHHKNGWNWCEEERFDNNNGVTLCYKCHKLFHSLYGNKDNTNLQYQNFIENK